MDWNRLLDTNTFVVFSYSEYCQIGLGSATFAVGVFSACLKKEYSESARGLLSFSSAYITFNDCNGKYGEGTDCLRMPVFKAISLINDLTETGQKDNRRETYL